MRISWTHLQAAFFSLLLAVVLLPARPADAALTYHREEIPGGGVLLVKETHELPMVTIRVSVRAGSRQETPKKAGLANLTAQLLSQGTRKHSAHDIEKINDRLGGGIGFSAGRINVTGSLKVLTRDLDEGFGLLAEALREPAFPAEEFTKTRNQILGGLREREDNPGHIANVAFRRALFGDRAAGRVVEGSSQTLPVIQREDVVRFHKKWYGMKGSIFVFVGDVSVQRARELVRAYFAGWKAPGGEIPKVEEPPAPKGMQVLTVDRDLTQATVLLGNRSLTRKDPHFYAARVMNYILGGGGFESRILNNIREEKGLVYAAYSYFASGLYTGHWRLFLQTKNESANQAIEESIAEVKRMQEKGVTDQELQEAKDFITGSFATRFGSSARIASFILALERLGFPPDYADRYPELIRGVTKEQALEAARKYIKLDESVLTVVGNLSKAKLKFGTEPVKGEGG